MKPLRIFLADDHPIIRDGLKALIEQQPDMQVVGEADNGRDAWNKAALLRPDVAIIDVSMPDMDGVKVTESLRHECPDIRVLALTVYEDEIYVQQMLMAGASGYIVKRTASEKLIEAVRTLAAGGMYLDPRITGKMIKRYMRNPEDDKTANDPLSDREEQVLSLIAWGYSNKEIAARLSISVKTVETYKSRLMEKLNFKSRTDIVRYAVRRGWLHDPYKTP
jgi:DNA-binding NarL/FixJ family response regulator